MAVTCTAVMWWLAAAIAWADAPPSNDGGPPTISGTPQQGDVLSADPGGWSGDAPITFSYQWSDGQSGQSITLSSTDVGQSLTVTVDASNGVGDATATSGSVGPVLPAAPTLTPGDPPAITGTPQQGDTLNVSNGTWSDNSATFAYAWADCDDSGNCVPITGATSSSYTLQSSDVGSTVVATVTASNKGGANSAASAATAPVLPAAPGLVTAPGITGTAQQGKALSVSTGAWSNNPTTFSYAWEDCGTTGSPCSPISGAISSTYVVQSTDVNQYVSVKVTAMNSGGRGAVTTASVGPVLPPAPVNSQAPAITPASGTLSVSNGSWSNSYPGGFSYAWKSCDSSGRNCTPIPGATSSSYALSLADVGSTIVCVVTATGPGGSTSKATPPSGIVQLAQIPAASQSTTTGLLATPSTPVTNQNVTLIATITAGTSSTALWGTITFENGQAAIQGCANMPAVPSGRSATVACSTSFGASSPQLSAVFTPASGSILKGSVSPATGLTIGSDSSSTSLDAPQSVTVGASISYTASVTPPAARPGPVQPTGSVEFLDGGQPIGACASLPLANGAATCTVSYATPGAHQITARYSGDANFGGSSSPTEHVSAASAPTTVLGTISSTMQWAFFFTPKYTVVRTLAVNGLAPGARVIVKCQGRGCPFASHATLLTKGKRCGRKAKRSCTTPTTLNVASAFAGRHLRVGTRITISIVRPNWVGKSYSFTIRPRRGPRVQIGSVPAA